jgi:hypothetical protein
MRVVGRCIETLLSSHAPVELFPGHKCREDRVRVDFVENAAFLKGCNLCSPCREDISVLLLATSRHTGDEVGGLSSGDM